MMKKRKALFMGIFALLILAGCLPAPNVSVTTPVFPNTGATSLPQATPTDSGGSTIPPANQTVTLADNGKTITLPVGQAFLLQLGSDYVWTVNVADQTILSRVVNVLVIRGAQGLYKANQPGQTTLTASGDPMCRQSAPPCEQPSLNFQITVSVVQESGGSPTPRLNLKDVRMFSTQTGWATGWPSSAGNTSATKPAAIHIYRTQDGGHTWKDITPTAGESLPTTAFFLNSKRAWFAAVTPSGAPQVTVTIYQTADKGKTWQAGQPLHSQEGLPSSLNFVDEQHGWLVTSSGAAAGSQPLSIFASSDGGQSWDLVSSTSSIPGSLPSSCLKTGIGFRDAANGWATGACADGSLFLYTTPDAGTTWNTVMMPPPSGYPANLFSNCMCEVRPMQWPTVKDGFVAITIAGAQPAVYLYASHDSGATWTPYKLPLSRLVVNPVFINAIDGWVTDGVTLFRTQDGGQKWKDLGKLPAGNMSSLDFTSMEDGLLTDGQQRYITHDGGASWNAVQP